MAGSSQVSTPPTPRVALYLRVSTDRQAESDLSIPDQRRQMTVYALAKGWTVTDEFVEPGVTATDEKRPAFLAMIEAGLTKPPPFDKILVHSFSRFFRDQFQFEFYVRKLDRNHVRLISITQELGDDPMSLMMRQIMALFDEYQSRENAKHTLRAMKENARQGFWNGSRPPFGYRVVDAGRRGEKMKRRLEIDPEQAEAVRLIFRLALRGDGSVGPMGVKAIAAYLNDRGVATRDGGRWGNGNIHHILTCPTYMGEHHFNVRSFKTGERKAPDEHAIGVAPPIIERAMFEELQSLLKRRHPKSRADRIVSGSVLLSGVAYCGLCGGPMHLASGKDGRYRYYACLSRASDGPASCGQVRVRMEVVDAAVIDFLETQLLCPPLLTELMADLVDHTDQGAKQRRRRELDLRKRMENAELRLARLYAAVEAGVLDADDPQLKDRIADLKHRRDKARHQTLQDPASPVPMTPKSLEAVALVVRQALRADDSGFRRELVRALVQRVEINSRSELSISGDRNELLQVMRAANSEDAALR